MKTVKVSTLVPVSLFVFTPFASISADSFVPDSEGDLGLPNFEQSDSGPRHSEPEPIVLRDGGRHDD